jgi:hypothetical protein
MFALMILAILKQDVFSLQRNMTTITHVPMTNVHLDMVFPIPQSIVMITTLVLMTGVIILLDVNTTNTVVMITTLVLKTLVMNIMDALMFLFQLMMTTNVLMIIVAQLMEFTTPINQFLIMMPVKLLHVVLPKDGNLLLYNAMTTTFVLMIGAIAMKDVNIPK